MQKELRQHLIYGAVIILITVGMVLYENKVTNETRQMLSQQITQLSQQLNEAKQELIESDKLLIEQDVLLAEKDSSIEKSIENLGGEIEKKETQIKMLSGELEDVKTKSEQQVTELQKKLSDLKAQYQDFSDIIDSVVKSVVSVQTNTGEGSGFLIDSRGYIVTNNHVIDDATAGRIVTSDGKKHAVRIVGSDVNADIAVLKIEGDFPRLRFADSGNVRVGEKVIAVGSPGGLDFTVTQGIVSATNRESRGNTYIQIDVPINPGNSGGPLVNANGRVIGVNTLKLAGFEGLGFAIVSNEVDDIVDRLIADDVVAEGQ